MPRLSGPLALLPLLACLGPASAAPPAAPPPLALTHVTVIDTAGGPSQTDMTVVVADGRIRDLGKADRVPVPDSARVVDGTGKFLIPGLWDMHVHIASPAYLPLFVANGVTGVREMHAFFPAGEGHAPGRGLVPGRDGYDQPVLLPRLQPAR
jgi:predicted amidohydrolase YtcJ